MLPTRARSFLAVGSSLAVDNTHARARARTRTRHMIVISITRGAAPLAANLSFATGAYGVRAGGGGDGGGHERAGGVRRLFARGAS